MDNTATKGAFIIRLETLHDDEGFYLTEIDEFSGGVGCIEEALIFSSQEAVERIGKVLKKDHEWYDYCIVDLLKLASSTNRYEEE